ncbi:MAG: chromate efflux transporter [Marinobacter sp.]|nr:chromate efflux transporter [Marinobacter sp.]
MSRDVSAKKEVAGALPSWHIFLLFLRLGLTSFGGPAAHLGFFHEEFVKRRRWMSDAAYGEAVALCQLLPGPASSQVGLTIGFLQRGYAGAAAAWLGFTLPSAVLMTLLALGLGLWPEAGAGGWITGLKLFVVAVVAQAVWQMGRNLCPDGPRLSIAVVVAVLLLTVGATWMQILALLIAGAAGAALKLPQKHAAEALTIPVQTRRPMAFFAVFVVLLVLAFLPMDLGSLGWVWAELYRAGALVFGGGHVVLPWLQEGFVASGNMPADTFLAGYGVAQAMPGPLFSFSAFLGGIENGVSGAVVAVIAVFLPGTLLVFAGLPLWSYIRKHELVRASLAGVNAGVVGLLLAALYDPVWTSAVDSSGALGFVMLAWVSLAVWRVPVWILAPGSALAGLLLF